MLMTIEEARKIMGTAGKKYTDEEIQEIINLFYALSNLVIDRYIEAKNKGDKKWKNQHSCKELLKGWNYPF